MKIVLEHKVLKKAVESGKSLTVTYEQSKYGQEMLAFLDDSEVARSFKTWIEINEDNISG